MAAAGQTCRCIRCREVRREAVALDQLGWQTLVYPSDVSTEYFLSATTGGGRVAGFLRLSLPKRGARVRLKTGERQESVFDEIGNCAMIREVHVYGPALAVGVEGDGEAQHSGIGQELIARARDIATAQHFRQMAVIAAVGTRAYYRRLGFAPGATYMAMEL